MKQDKTGKQEEWVFMDSIIGNKSMVRKSITENQLSNEKKKSKVREKTANIEYVVLSNCNKEC